MKTKHKLLIGILSIAIVAVVLITSYFLYFSEEDKSSSDSNGIPSSGPDVTIELTSNKTTYAVDEEVVLYYHIRNNEATNLSLEVYEININLKTGSNQVLQLYELTETLGPGEEVNGSVDVNWDLEPGEHIFEINLQEIKGPSQYFLHQTKRLVINVE